MNDIKNLIGQILYEKDSLIIPDLGGFVSSYRAADIDHVQGMIHPPSKKLSFNKNLLINDGVLINYLQEQFDLSVKEAKKMLVDFVHRTQARLDNREIVVFPGVGRLYKDYENNLQFLQDNTNFNTQAYGLPVLEYYPILRTRKMQTSVELETRTYPMPQRAKTNRRRMTSVVLPFALIAIIVAAAMIVYNNQNQTSPSTQTLPVAENRINQRPGTQEQLSIFEGLKKSFDNPIEDTAETTEPEPEVIEEVTSPDTEETTLAPDMKECVIIIGAFGNKANVERRVNEIIELGYSVYQDKKGKLTRVGIQFAYQYPAEIGDKLDAMRDHFDNRSWVLQE